MHCTYHGNNTITMKTIAISTYLTRTEGLFGTAAQVANNTNWRIAT